MWSAQWLRPCPRKMRSRSGEGRGSARPLLRVRDSEERNLIHLHHEKGVVVLKDFFKRVLYKTCSVVSLVMSAIQVLASTSYVSALLRI